MAIRHLCVTILVLSSLSTVQSQDVNDQRIDRIRGRSRKIQRKLVYIEHRPYDCNDTVYDVIDKMNDVSGKVEELYKGPYLAKLDLSEGYGYRQSNQVLLEVADPVERCIESYKDSHVSRKDARMRCIQQVIWNYQLPGAYENPDNYENYQNLGKYDKEFQGLRKYIEWKNGNNAGEYRPVGETTTSEKYPSTTQLYRFRRLLQFTSTTTPLVTSTLYSGSSTTGPNLRVRKEYRCLTLAERTRFHNALNVLYDNGTIRHFAEVHRNASRGAHGGPAFLPWHRVFITRFENALREVDPSVTLPYWDSTMDDCMANPALSTMWSEDFVGNGFGMVITGPFAGWTSEDWFLERSYAQRGNLVRRFNINRALTRCSYSQITVPTGRRRFRIESFHNGVHIWVGGDMNGVRTSPYDPVFYMHHCFIDYIWEKFRERQVFCGNDPETDYIPASGRHNYNSRMAPRRQTTGPELDEQGDYRVRDGMSNYWTDEVFRYEDPPSCANNCCDSEHLYCDQAFNCCVPYSRFGEGVSTSTPFFTSTPPARRRRGAMMMMAAARKPLPEVTVLDKTTPEPDDDCDQYLDPGCYLQTARRYSKQKRQIPIDQEIALINSLVDKNRGEKFGLPSEPDDQRNLNTVAYDEENYDVFRKETLAEEASREIRIQITGLQIRGSDGFFFKM